MSTREHLSWIIEGKLSIGIVMIVAPNRQFFGRCFFEKTNPRETKWSGV